MNSIQAKQISIVDYLSSQGIESAKQYSTNFMYKSPFREERTPSFSVHPAKNLWKDHGDGTGGNIIDLVMRMHDVNVSGALQILEKHCPDASFFSSPATNTYSSGIIIRKVKPLQTKGLLGYLRYRAIRLEIAANYIKEAYYTTLSNEHKQFYALCFQNDKGGYELRSKVGEKDYKFSTSPKYITTIPGKDGSAVNIFEGFFDFLSALTCFNCTTFKYTTIILNSLVHVPIIAGTISKFPQVNTFLDNDTAGNKALDDLLQIHPHVENQAHYYAGYKDFNEFLQAKRPLL